MSDQYHNGGDEERRAAEERIRRMRSGGFSTQPVDDGLGESDALSRARSRAQAVRDSLDAEPEPVSQGRAPVDRTAPSGRGRQAIIVIGGVVAIGVLIVLVIILVTSLGGGGISLPGAATSTPEPTATPEATATQTPEPTATPTREAPNLSLPPLTCIFQSGPGCFDYCNDAANQAECDSAREYVEAQGADSEAWLTCIASAPGPNVGNPQDCLEDAWRIRNP